MIKLFPAEQLAEHELQNSTVPVIIDLDRRIDSQDYRDRFGFVVFPVNFEFQFLPWLNRIRQTSDRKFLRTIESECLRACSFLKLQRQHAHPDQIRPVDSLKAGGYNRLHA